MQATSLLLLVLLCGGPRLERMAEPACPQGEIPQNNQGDWTPWEALAKDPEGGAVVSSRLRWSRSIPDEGEEWVLNLRNDTEKVVSLVYTWRLHGQSHAGNARLEPSRILEVAKVFPKGTSTKPELTLVDWRFGD